MHVMIFLFVCVVIFPYGGPLKYRKSKLLYKKLVAKPKVFSKDPIQHFCGAKNMPDKGSLSPGFEIQIGYRRRRRREALALTTTARLLLLSQRSEGDREDSIRELIEPTIIRKNICGSIEPQFFEKIICQLLEPQFFEKNLF